MYKKKEDRKKKADISVLYHISLRFLEARSYVSHKQKHLSLSCRNVLLVMCSRWHLLTNKNNMDTHFKLCLC